MLSPAGVQPSGQGQGWALPRPSPVPLHPLLGTALKVPGALTCTGPSGHHSFAAHPVPSERSSALLPKASPISKRQEQVEVGRE